MRRVPYLILTIALTMAFSGCGDEQGTTPSPLVYDGTSPDATSTLPPLHTVTVEPDDIRIEADFADFAPFTLTSATDVDLVVTFVGESPYIEVGCHPYHSGSGAEVDVPLAAHEAMTCEVIWYSLGHGDYSGEIDLVWSVDGVQAGATSMHVEGIQLD